MIDIDTHDRDYINAVRREIEQLQSEIKNNQYKILAEVPTLQGSHLICNPFRLDKFKQKFPEIETHKNNPTILFIS